MRVQLLSSLSCDWEADESSGEMIRCMNEKKVGREAMEIREKENIKNRIRRKRHPFDSHNVLEVSAREENIINLARYVYSILLAFYNTHIKT